MSDILFEVEHHVATITLNRPDRLNAISGPMLASLAEKLLEYDRAREVRVVVLTGAGRGFCAGLDLKDTAAGAGGDGPGYANDDPHSNLTEASAPHSNPLSPVAERRHLVWLKRALHRAVAARA